MRVYLYNVAGPLRFVFTQAREWHRGSLFDTSINPPTWRGACLRLMDDELYGKTSLDDYFQLDMHLDLVSPCSNVSVAAALT